MDKACINCVYYADNECELHSDGYIARISHPKSYSCDDFEPYEDDTDTDLDDGSED